MDGAAAWEPVRPAGRRDVTDTGGWRHYPVETTRNARDENIDYGDARYDDARYEDGRYDDGRYEDVVSAGRHEFSGFEAYPGDARSARGAQDDPRYPDARYDEPGYDGYDRYDDEFAYDAHYREVDDEFDSADATFGDRSGFAADEDAYETTVIPAVAAGDERPAPTRVGRRRRAPEKRPRRRRGRILAALAVLVVLAVGALVGGRALLGGGSAPDYAGPGGPEVVVEVRPGDTAEQIAEAMAERNVVASSAAFYNAALASDGMNSMQPGFYSVPTEISGTDAVAALVDPGSRVGQMVVSEGRQLHDTVDVNTGATKKGIYTLISEASCIGEPGAQSCITYQDLDAAGAGDMSALGVPDWALDRVASVPDRDRQLEGLIAAGSWDFDPTATPLEILRKLVTESAASYEKTGIRTAGAAVGMSPYEILVAASLVEREALPGDFAKVARVIVNRLEVGQALQFDSTVNYALDTTELATTDADRAEVTPWNTYASPGLPATPISSPSIAALQAVEAPEPGDWLYFVTIDDKGTTLFTRDYQEHLSNIEFALDAGILRSGR
ncbi:endolytic transglycosylase MltG [Rhodococcus sp. HNM0569]|uniref:endolytic transglycosylase MltG n=1 Tax=Rhodococcus sp. HNM0569 TaxID=2716340 RepID=UPI00146EABBE|nr:endolytic transglycosylase MltG [Rhodococcus sp. HNM0569]